MKTISILFLLLMSGSGFAQSEIDYDSTGTKIKHRVFKAPIWRAKFGSFLYNHNAYSGDSKIVSNRFFQPIAGLENVLDRKSVILTSQGQVSQFLGKNPYLPPEYQFNENLKIKNKLLGMMPLLHFRFDHQYYLKGTSASPQVVKNNGAYLGAGIWFRSSFFGKQHLVDLFYLRSLTSRSVANDMTSNLTVDSLNVVAKTSLDKKWIVETHFQTYSFHKSSEKVEQFKLFALLGYRFR